MVEAVAVELGLPIATTDQIQHNAEEAVHLIAILLDELRGMGGFKPRHRLSHRPRPELQDKAPPFYSRSYSGYKKRIVARIGGEAMQLDQYSFGAISKDFARRAFERIGAA